VCVEPSFGDLVRIVAAPETAESGFAGREGQVFGESIPSRSGVGPVIGDRGEDYAFSVFFEDTDEQAWFAPHRVQFLERTDADDPSGEGSALDPILESRQRLPFAVPDPDGQLKRWLERHDDNAK